MSKITYAMDNPEARAIMEQFTLEDHRRRLADSERSRLRPMSDYLDDVKDLHQKQRMTAELLALDELQGLSF